MIGTSNPVAWIVAGLSAAGLTGSLYALQLVPRLGLSGWLTVTCYGAAALIILCFGLFLFAMLWGMQTDWTNPAKTAMLLGAVTAVPASAGLLVLIVAGAVGTDGAARSYLLGLGLAGLLLLAIPAVVLIVMALPGKP
jgi:hypothetical protein